MRAAIPTKAQLAPVAALRYLHVALGHAPQQHKGAFHGWHGCAKRPARQGLTIGTMANDYIVGICRLPDFLALCRPEHTSYAFENRGLSHGN